MPLTGFRQKAVTGKNQDTKSIVSFVMPITNGFRYTSDNRDIALCWAIVTYRKTQQIHLQELIKSILY